MLNIHIMDLFGDFDRLLKRVLFFHMIEMFEKMFVALYVIFMCVLIIVQRHSYVV